MNTILKVLADIKMEWNTKPDKTRARLCYTACTMLCMIKSLHKENLHLDQHFKISADSTPTATRKTPETPLWNFSMGYSAKTALPCAEGAAATRQERTVSAQGQDQGPACPAPSTSDWSRWCRASHLRGRRAQERLCRLLGAPRHQASAGQKWTGQGMSCISITTAHYQAAHFQAQHPI